MEPTKEDLRVAREIATDTYITLLPTETARLTRHIASAIAAEREKAAKIAETKYIDAGFHHYFRNASICIAAAIRAGDKSS